MQQHGQRRRRRQGAGGRRRLAIVTRGCCSLLWAGVQSQHAHGARGRRSVSPITNTLNLCVKICVVSRRYGKKFKNFFPEGRDTDRKLWGRSKTADQKCTVNFRFVTVCGLLSKTQSPSRGPQLSATPLAWLRSEPLDRRTRTIPLVLGRPYSGLSLHSSLAMHSD
jgi:hypothetical protein